MEEKKNETIKSLKNECKESSNLNEIRKKLFEISKEKGNAKIVTGITREALDEFSREDIINMSQNIDSKDRLEFIKIMKLSNIEFKDILAIFDKDNLLTATKEFGVKVTSNDLYSLFEKSHDRDKGFIEFLISMNPSEAQSITEIVLDNYNGEELLSIIRDNNLKLSSEQLQNILSQNEGVSDINEQFLETVSTLSSRNSELVHTINYEILSDKFKGIEKYLPIITCHPNIQQKIIDLSENEYQSFVKCLDYYSGITPDWTNIAEGLLNNINQYKELIVNLDDAIFSNLARMELLTKVLSEPNYFQIKSLDEYLNKKDKICNEIINNPNITLIPSIENMSEIDKTRFAILEKNYGISLNQAQSLIAKFNEDIDTIDQSMPENRYYRGLIESLNFICNNQDIEDLTSHFYSSSNRAINVDLIERQIKDAYDKEYTEKLYRPTENDLLSQEEVSKYLAGQGTEGIQFYLAGKSTNGQFFMESHAPGAVYSDSMLKGDTPRYADSWNKPLMSSQAFCTHLTSNQMLYSNIRDVEYGYYNYEQGSLRAAGYDDISSDYTHFTGFADQDEKYSSMQQRIDKTRENDESDRARVLPDGTKRQPDYIRLLTSRHIPKQLAIQKLEHSKLAAQQFSERTGKQIPIVIVDQDECTRQENEIIRSMIKDFQDTKNPELISNIITRFENNRTGNRLMYGGLKRENIDFSIDTPTNTDEFGKTIITRNEMLTILMNVIEQCQDKEQAKKLYTTLNSSITSEVDKVKKPEYKILNDEGIPVVQKRKITLENYFSKGRNRENGEFIKISAYEKFVELGKEFLELNSEDKRIVNESNEYIESSKLIKDSMMHGINHTKCVDENSLGLSVEGIDTPKEFEHPQIFSEQEIGKATINRTVSRTDKALETINKAQIENQNNIVK